MNEIVLNIAELDDHFRTKVLPLRFGQRLTDIGSINLRKIFYLIVFVIRLISAMIIFRPRLVYFTIMPTGKVFYRDAMLAAIARFFGAKMIFHLHGKGVAAAAAASPALARRYRNCFRHAYLICLSASLLADIAPVYRGNPFVVANGIADRPLPPNSASNQVPVVIYLSNLMLSKGIKILLEAVLLLHRENLAFELQVVGGEGDLRLEEAREYCKSNGISDKVSILGPKYGGEKEALLDEADIFVLPSKNECFPLVILEAMRAGLPVVSTWVGGIPDLVRDQKTGLLVEPGSVEDLAAALRTLIRGEKKRLEWGEQGRRDFEDFYTLKHFRQNMLDVFLRIKEDISH